MPRKLRLHVPGGVYHVMTRGNDKQKIFYSSQDYWKLSLLIKNGLERFQHKILAFCYMENHIHLVIQVEDTPLSTIMHNLNFRYTQYINNKLERVGHLFQGRFKSILVDSEAYLDELIRYVHLNPVRANIVSLPEEYSWSSYRDYLGYGKCTWVDTSQVLDHFNLNRDIAVESLKNHTLAGLQDSQKEFEKSLKGEFLGDEKFIRRLGFEVRAPGLTIVDIPKIIDAFGEQLQLSQADLRSSSKERHITRGRAILAYIVSRIEGARLSELAEVLGRNVSTLSRQLKGVTKDAKLSSSFSEELSDLERKIRDKIKGR